MKLNMQSVLEHQAFDLETLEVEAIGGSIGSSVGERIAENVNSGYHDSFYHSYGHSTTSGNYVTQVANQQRASSTANPLSNADTSRSEASHDPASSYGVATQAKNVQYAKKMNQFGVFGGGKQTPNQAHYAEQQAKTVIEQTELGGLVANDKGFFQGLTLHYGKS